MNVESLVDAWDVYRAARQHLLDQLDRPGSNRDPLVEFSERLVATLVGGHLASSLVQKDYDVIGPRNERIQVKYLANRGNKWVNEHCIRFTGEMDSYVVVFFDDLHPTFAVSFPRNSMTSICQLLGKRHPNQELTLQLTQRNLKQILEHKAQFAGLGVTVTDVSISDNGGLKEQ